MIGLVVDLGFLGGLAGLEAGDSIDAAAFAHRVDLAGADRVVIPLSDGDLPGFIAEEVARIIAILRIPFTVSIRGLELLDAALEFSPDEILFLDAGGGAVTMDLVDAADGPLAAATARTKAAGVTAVLLVPPHPAAVLAAQDAGATMVEIDTGVYGRTITDGQQLAAHHRISEAVRTASGIGMRVRAGGGAPDASRLTRLAALREVESVRVGAALLRHVVYEGVSAAVADVRRALDRGESRAEVAPDGEPDGEEESS